MTSKVQLVVNGSNYVLRAKVTDPTSGHVQEYSVRGAPQGRGASQGQGFMEFYLQQGFVAEVTEHYEPQGG